MSEQAEHIRSMTAELAQLRQQQRELLAGLPGAADTPADPEVRAHFDSVRHSQRMWEERMSDLLAAVSRLQGPPSRGTLSGRNTAGGGRGAA